MLADQIVAKPIDQRDDRQLIDGGNRSLGCRIVGSQRLDRVAEKLEPHRRVAAGRIHVEDAAAESRTRLVRPPDLRA